MTIWKKQRGAVAFQSTPPARGATAENGSNNGLKLFQSTPPARGATRRGTGQLQVLDISIHAPREGGDCGVLQRTHWLLYFNPRPPRGGRPDRSTGSFALYRKFQSTPPARGATKRKGNLLRRGHYFNPRPPRGGRHVVAAAIAAAKRNFNPRPPRGGRPV